MRITPDGIESITHLKECIDELGETITSNSKFTEKEAVGIILNTVASSVLQSHITKNKNIIAEKIKAPDFSDADIERIDDLNYYVGSLEESRGFICKWL